MTERAAPRVFPLEQLLLFLLAVAEGLIVSNKAAFFLIADEVFGMDVLGFGYIDMLATLLVCMKPFYGYISDVYPLWGMRRKSYLFLFSALGILCYYLIAVSQAEGFHMYAVVALYMLAEVANVIRTVMTEAICVETSRRLKEAAEREGAKPAIDTLYVLLLGKHGGTVLSTFLIRSLFKALEARIFLLYALACTITLAVAAVLREEAPAKAREKKNILHEFANSYRIVARNGLVLTVCANMVIISSPYLQNLFSYFARGVLHFDDKLITDKSLVSKMSAFLAVLSRGILFARLDRIALFKLSALANVLSVLFFFLIFFSFRGSSPLGTLAAFAFTAVEAYTTELRNIPLMETFVEKSPRDSDGLFISVLSFCNSIAKTASLYFSNVLVSLLHISKKNFSNGPVMIISNVFVALLGYILLEFSFAKPLEQPLEPPKPQESQVVEETVAPVQQTDANN